MRSTAFNNMAVVWLALWFGVIVPGHKRGLVLLPGGTPPPATRPQAGETCPLAQMKGGTGTCCPTSNAPAVPSPTGPASHCAVCYLTGVLDVPPAPDLTPKPLELLQILPWPKPITVASASTTHIYLGRAPPTA